MDSWIDQHLADMLTALVGLLGTIAVAWCKRIAGDLKDLRVENEKQGERIAALEAITHRIHK